MLGLKSSDAAFEHAFAKVYERQLRDHMPDRSSWPRLCIFFPVRGSRCLPLPTEGDLEEFKVPVRYRDVPPFSSA